MPDGQLLTIQEVASKASIEQIVSRPGLRINCDVCGEEIMNAREVLSTGLTLCRAFSGAGYYHSAIQVGCRKEFLQEL